MDTTDERTIKGLCFQIREEAIALDIAKDDFVRRASVRKLEKYIAAADAVVSANEPW